MAVWGDKMGRNMMQNTRATNGEYIFQLCKYGRNKLIYIVNKGLIKGERRQKSEKFCEYFNLFCSPKRYLSVFKELILSAITYYSALFVPNMSRLKAWF